MNPIQGDLSGLAALPAEDPMPVLRMSSDGTLLYANKASSRLLQDWQCGVGRPVPDHISGLVAECLAGGQPREGDVACQNLVFSIMSVPLPDKGFVNLYARDVTERRRAEAALVLSERRLRLALEAAGLGVWQVDLRAGIGLQDPRVAELFGCPPEQTQVSPREWEARIHPDDRPRVLAECGRIIHGDPAHDVQFRVLRPDGSVCWVAASAQAQRDPAGEPLRIYGVAADITEHKLAEQAVRESEEKYRSIFRTAGNLILSLDHQGTVLDCNARVEAVLGYAPEELIGQPMSRVLHPEDVPTARAAMRGILDGNIHRGEYRMIRKDGTMVHVSISSSALQDEPGLRSRTVCLIDDITERRRDLETLRSQEEQLRIAQEAAGAGMWNWHIASNQVTWSPEYYDVYGLDRSLSPSYDNWLACIHEQDRQTADQAMRDAIEGCSDTHIEFRVLHPQRGLRWLASIGRTICGDDGHPVRMTGLTLDITDRRQFLEQLQALNATLEQRVAERTAVAEERASQLRMLAGQLTQAEQRERRRIAYILHEHFQQLLAAAKFQLGVIRQHLAKPEPLLSIEQVNEALDQAIDTSRSLTVELSPPILYDAGLGPALMWLGHWMQERHGLRVEVRADPAAEPEDEDIRLALFLAARELLFNVVRHAKVSQASVSMTPGDGGRTRIMVSDAGAGFEPLASGSTLGGFGLFAIRERLDMLGGQIEVHSRPGQGTRAVLHGPPPGTLRADTASEPPGD